MTEFPDAGIAIVADDHGLYRRGLSLLLQDRLGFSEVIEAASFDEALDMLAENANIKLALFDLTMPGMGGPESLAVVRETYPALRLAIVTASEERDHVVESVSTGLDGYLPKSLSDDEIVAALEGIMQGQVYVPRLVTNGIPLKPHVSVPRTPRAAGSSGEIRLEDLTPRQRDVLRCISKGCSNKEIARELDIAEGTVKIHLAALFTHFGVRNRTELATRAQRLVEA
jgi:DNA-binding NarL/FixJ family response regulator